MLSLCPVAEVPIFILSVMPSLVRLTLSLRDERDSFKHRLSGLSH